MNIKPGVIAVDFDGTLCEHQFPEIGPEVPGAFAVLKDLQAAGHRLILWTMRDDGRKGDTPESDHVMTKAVAWCAERGVEFWAHNRNPEQGGWTCSPKCYAQLYIDDAALGCPLRRYKSRRPVVNWRRVRRWLIAQGWLPGTIAPRQTGRKSPAGRGLG